MSEVFDREEFRLWLVTQEPDAVVGHPMSVGECVLARFLKDETGLTWVSVCPPRRSWINLDPSKFAVHRLPDWAATFGEQFDVRFFLSGGATAKRVLELFDGVEP